MNAKHLSALWSSVGTVLLYWTLNTWIVMQGGAPFLDLGLILEDPAGAQVIAFHVCPVLLALLLSIAIAHAKASKAERWSARLPYVAFDDLDHSQRSARLYQAVFVLVFLVIPAAGLVHFAYQMKDMWVVYTDAQLQGQAAHGVWAAVLLGLPWEYFDLAGERFRIGPGHSPAEIIENGVTWFPFSSIVFFVSMTVLAAIQAFRLARSLTR